MTVINPLFLKKISLFDLTGGIFSNLVFLGLGYLLDRRL